MISIELIETSKNTYSFYEFDIVKKAQGFSDKQCFGKCLASNYKFNLKQVTQIEEFLEKHNNQIFKESNKQFVDRSQFVDYCVSRVSNRDENILIEQSLKEIEDQEENTDDFNKLFDQLAQEEENYGEKLDQHFNQQEFEQEDQYEEDKYEEVDYDLRDNGRNIHGLKDLGNNDDYLYLYQNHKKNKMRTPSFNISRHETVGAAIASALFNRNRDF